MNTSVCTKASKRADVFRAAYLVIGDLPADMGRTNDESYRKVVWTGIVMENLPDIGLPEASERAGMLRTRHSAVHDWLKKWRDLPWRVRHGWLMMAEAAMSGKEYWKPYLWHDELNRMCNESHFKHRGFKHAYH